MLKRMFLTAVTTSMIAGGALAADLRGAYNETPSPFGGLPVAASAGGFDWSGLYVGLHVGYGGGTAAYDYSIDNAGIAGSDTQRNNGIVGGVQVGYDYAIYDHVVVGLEADFDGASIGGRALLDQPGIYASVGSRINYFGTVRARLGYAFDRVMLYATGGFAYADTTTDVSAPNSNIADSFSHLHVGYAVGGGMRYAVTNNIMLRAEYLHLAFDGRTSTGHDPAQPYQIRAAPTEEIVRAGVDYKFDLFSPTAPSQPVYARY